MERFCIFEAASVSDPTRLSGRLVMKFQIRGESTLMEVGAEHEEQYHCGWASFESRVNRFRF